MKVQNNDISLTKFIIETGPGVPKPYRYMEKTGVEKMVFWDRLRKVAVLLSSPSLSESFFDDDSEERIFINVSTIKTGKGTSGMKM